MKPVPSHPQVGTEYGVPGDWAASVHTGRDYPAPSGAAVVATRAGRVSRVSYDGDYGNRVEIMTGDIQHSYNHLSATHVAPGQNVAEGARIGSVGSTGRSTGPHLHYEERCCGPDAGYYNHRRPEFDVSAGNEEDDMIIINSDGRQPSLVGAGYAKELTDEEYNVLRDMGVREATHSDRGYDVARAACLYGDATD